MPSGGSGLVMTAGRLTRPGPRGAPRAAVALAWVVGVEVVLAIGIALALVQGGSSLTSLANASAPTGMLVATWFVAYRIMKADELSIWTPLPWYLAACGLYFGVGPLLYVIGSETLRRYLTDVYSVSDADLLRVNLLNVVGVGVTLALVALYSRAVPRSFPNPKREAHRGFCPGRLAVLFLGIGLPVKYLLALPYRFGLVHWVLPGAVLNLDQFVSISIIPMSLVAWRRKNVWTGVWLAVVFSELATALLQFSKWAILQVLICVILGIELRRKGLRFVVVAGLGSVAVAVMLTSFVQAARGALTGVSGQFYRGTLDQRAAVAAEVWKSDREESRGLNRFEAFWVRICYVPEELFGMNQYNSGSSGNSVLMAVFAPVPRVFWSEKPIITSVGTGFNELMTGSASSASSPTVYGELYWNGGWLGVVFGAAFVGILFCIIDRYSRWAIVGRRWHLLPVVIMGLTMGYRIDGWFAGDFFNPVPIMIACGIALSILWKVLGSAALGNVSL